MSTSKQEDSASGANAGVADEAVEDGVAISPPKSQGGNAHASTSSSHAATSSHKRETPLPMVQMTALALILMSESICGSMLLPFVGLLVAKLENRPEDEAGYTAGVLVGAFMLGQVIASKWWGRFSDKYGRKTPLVLGLVAGGIIIFFFGISQNIVLSIVLRLFHGLTNGNVLVAKTMIAEITDRTNEAKGFMLISLTWGIGSLFGPAIGGLLYDPARTAFGRWFGMSPEGFFHNYPAFLPCFVIFVYTFLCIAVCIKYINETHANPRPLSEAVPVVLRNLLPLSVRGCAATQAADVVVVEHDATPDVTRDHARSKAAPEAKDAAAATTAPSAAPRHQHKRSLGYVAAFKDTLTRYTLILYMVLSAADAAFMGTLPLWTIATHASGGLEMNSTGTGMLLLINSFPSILANTIFPAMCRRVRSKLVFWRYSQTVMLVTSFIAPIATYAGNFYGRFIFLATVNVIRQFGISWCYSLAFMFTARSTTRDNVGAMYGISQASAAVVRCIVPLLASPMFAWSISGSHIFPFNHFFVFIVFALPLVWGITLSLKMHFDKEGTLYVDGCEPSHGSVAASHAASAADDDGESDVDADGKDPKTSSFTAATTWYPMVIVGGMICEEERWAHLEHGEEELDVLSPDSPSDG